MPGPWVQIGKPEESKTLPIIQPESESFFALGIVNDGRSPGEGYFGSEWEGLCIWIREENRSLFEVEEWVKDELKENKIGMRDRLKMWSRDLDLLILRFCRDYRDETWLNYEEVYLFFCLIRITAGINGIFTS